jgi:hypothetical protein
MQGRQFLPESYRLIAYVAHRSADKPEAVILYGREEALELRKRLGNVLVYHDPALLLVNYPEASCITTDNEFRLKANHGNLGKFLWTDERLKDKDVVKYAIEPFEKVKGAFLKIYWCNLKCWRTRIIENSKSDRLQTFFNYLQWRPFSSHLNLMHCLEVFQRVL